MSSPSSTPVQRVSSRTTSVRIPGQWLPFARSVWVVCALLLLANFVASIPAYYRLLNTVCTLLDPSNCATGQLTPETAQVLANLHISLSSYAAYFGTLEVILSLLPWGLGLLIFWRKSDEWMGLLVSLLLIIFGSAGTINALLGIWAGTNPSPPLSTLFNLIEGVQWIGLGAFLLTFPTGRFVPRWSWLVLMFWIISFLWNPSPTLLTQILQGATSLMTFGGTLFIIVYRYIRVFDTNQRQQAKWFVYAVVISLCLLFIGTASPGAVPANSPILLLSPIIILFSSAIFYVGLGFAILRYRLYEIDRIINRTLVYSILTIILLAIYLGLIFALQYLLQGLVNQNSEVSIVISTLAIAALFQPLRHRIQRVIDRRFYRSKYDATKVIADFSSTLREEVDLNTLSERLVTVVQETMQPAHVSLWLRPNENAKKSSVVWSGTPPFTGDGQKV
jgi:hypothetical protein